MSSKRKKLTESSYSSISHPGQLLTNHFLPPKSKPHLFSPSPSEEVQQLEELSRAQAKQIKLLQSKLREVAREAADNLDDLIRANNQIKHLEQKLLVADFDCENSNLHRSFQLRLIRFLTWKLEHTRTTIQNWNFPDFHNPELPWNWVEPNPQRAQLPPRRETGYGGLFDDSSDDESDDDEEQGVVIHNLRGVGPFDV